MITFEDFKSIVGDFSTLANGGGSVTSDTGAVSIPPRSPDIWGSVSSVLKSGLDIYKNVVTATEAIKNPTNITRYNGIPAQYPYVFPVPNKAVTKQQSFGDILTNLPDAIKNLAQAPELVARGQQAGQQVSYTGIALTAGLVFLGIVLLMKMRRA